MWDKPEALNLIANALFAAAFLLALYAAVVTALRSCRCFRCARCASSAETRFIAPRRYARRSLRRELRGNFFTLDLARARARHSRALPWVRKADVRRHWPDRLEVTLEEHVPLARWGTLGLVNTQGEVFSATYEGKLPVFNGPAGSAKEMAIQYAYFRKSLEPIGREPVQVSVSARRAWTLRLDSGLTLELGRDEPGGSAGALRRRTMRRRRPCSGGAWSMSDLRYCNGFAVRVPELARAEAEGTSVNEQTEGQQEPAGRAGHRHLQGRRHRRRDQARRHARDHRHGQRSPRAG